MPYTLYLPQTLANPQIGLTPYGEQISIFDYLDDVALQAQCLQLGQLLPCTGHRYAAQG
ncbi:hypothetical protein ABHF33_09305 [Chitinibacter sp. FCG-7]|uniref:Uncharacterized protein n=1 Tax=Chitinibacter mangrovi TaxID=3153927 RepID=A0AAU7F5I6_9NEIS